MADVAISTGSEAPDGETANQRQARLRREKRQKKMAEQGEDRLAKIKALNGGVAPPDEVLGGPIKAPKPATMADDPDEVDISQSNSFAATPTSRQAPNPQNDPLAAAMLQMQKERQAQGGGEDDPMAKMMQQVQQMMGSMGGGGGGDPNDPASQQDLPPMLKAMMGAAGAGAKQEPAAPTNSSAYLWRIVHAVFAFGLALYICLSSTFNGTKLARSQNLYTEEAGYGLGPRLFIIFTSAELVLQSTRYFAEKGQLQGGGMLATVANSGFIPEPYANYIRILGRYLTIARTIFVDVMVVVFVLGCMAWWQGMAIEA